MTHARPAAAMRGESDTDGEGHPAPARAHVSLAALWFGVFGAPVAWSLQTLVNLPLSAHACFPRLEPLAAPVTGGVRGLAFAVSAAAILVCALALVVSLRAWRRTRHEHQRGSGRGEAHGPEAALLETGEGRTRFMALSGVLASATFLLVSLVHAATIFLVPPCAG